MEKTTHMKTEKDNINVKKNKSHENPQGKRIQIKIVLVRHGIKKREKRSLRKPP